MSAIGYVCLAVSLYAATQGFGQSSNFPAMRSEFRGQILDEDHPVTSGLVVEITSFSDRTLRERADVMNDGVFIFRSIPQGSYQVHVMTVDGNEVATAIANVGPYGAPFELRLPPNKLSRPGSGTVSLQQLQHPVSKQVQKLLEKGGKSLTAKNFEAAEADFRKALRDDPQCMQAHALLGLAYIRRSEWKEAVTEYRAAVALDPANSVIRSNLSAALASDGDFADAAIEAQSALKLDGHNPRAHFVMAGILLRDPRGFGDAVPHLAAAAESFPSARTALNKLCAARNITGCPHVGPSTF